MGKPQDTIGAEEFHYEIRVIGDSNIFGQHENGGSEGLASIRNILYSEIGKDNVKSHTHSEPPYWKIKIRPEHLNSLKTLVGSQNGLTLEEEVFQFKGMSIKTPALIDYLLSVNNRIDALAERNDGLISQLEKIESEHSGLREEYTRLEKEHSNVERKLSEARQAANLPPHIVPQDDSAKKKVSRLGREVSELRGQLAETKKIDRNISKFFNYNLAYNEGMAEAQKLYSAAGTDFDQKALEYYTPSEILNNEFGYKSKKELIRKRDQLEKRIDPIWKFTVDERNHIIINDDIHLDEFLEVGGHLFDESSSKYMIRRERTHLFGKDLGNRLRDHFAAIRSLEERGENYADLQKKLRRLERIRLAYEQHSDAIVSKRDRDRFAERVHKRLNKNG